MNEAILKLQETNRLLILKNRWWKEKRGGGRCKVNKDLNKHKIMILKVKTLCVISVLFQKMNISRGQDIIKPFFTRISRSSSPYFPFC